MRPKFSVLAACFIIATLYPITAFSQTQSTDQFYRWGVGWDDGIGFRYMFKPNWGVGLSLDPGLSDLSTDTDHGQADTPSYEEIESSDKSIRVGTLVFNHVSLGRWLGIGPYLLFSYEVRHGTTQSDQSATAYLDNEMTFTNRIYLLELGFRPTFTFERRFVLETRFGWRIRYSRSERTDIGVSPAYSRVQSQRYDEWNSDVTGKDLGPGAIMQFIIYF